MNRPANRSYGHTYKLFLFACLFSIASIAHGCGGESVDISFVYARYKNTPPTGTQPFTRINFALTSQFSQDANANTWNQFITNWNQNAPTWIKDQPLAPFPTIQCPVDANGLTGLIPTPGAPTTLSPFLHVATRADANGPSILEGRFPIHVACGRKAFPIFLAPPWQRTEWHQNSELTRVGHRITRLADGRYAISGGAETLAMGQANKTFLAKTTGTLLLYDPAKQTLESVKHPSLARAFHSAGWNRGRILLSGGINENDVVPNSALVLFTGKTEEQLSPTQLEELKCTGNNKVLSTPSREVICIEERTDLVAVHAAFQQTLRIPQKDNFQEASTVQIGGVVTKEGTPVSGGIHSLFHTATYLPNKRSILVTGGFYYNDKTSSFQATNFVYEVKLKGDNSFDGTPEIKAINGMAARAGHTAIRLDDTHVLLIGGVFGTLGGNGSSTEAFGGHTTAEVLYFVPDKNDPTNNTKGEWKSAKVDASQLPPSITHRAFHSARLLLEGNKPFDQGGDVGYLHINGGVAWSYDNNNQLQTKSERSSILLRITRTPSDTNPELPFVFQAIVHRDADATLPTQELSLQSAATLETGQLLYLGGAQLPQYQNKILTFAATGTSDLYTPGKELKDDADDPNRTFKNANLPDAPAPPIPPPAPDLVTCTEGKLCGTLRITGNASGNLNRGLVGHGNQLYHIGTFEGTLRLPACDKGNVQTTLQVAPGINSSHFVIKYNEALECQWAKTLSLGKATIASTAIDPGSGDLYITGSAKTDNTFIKNTKVCLPDNLDCTFAFLVKLSHDGQKQSFEELPGAEILTNEPIQGADAAKLSTKGLKVAVDDNRNIYVLQRSIGPNNSGELSFISRTSMDQKVRPTSILVVSHGINNPKIETHITIHDFRISRDANWLFIAGEAKGKIGKDNQTHFPNPTAVAVIMKQQDNKFTLDNAAFAIVDVFDKETSAFTHILVKPESNGQLRSIYLVGHTSAMAVHPVGSIKGISKILFDKSLPRPDTNTGRRPFVLPITLDDNKGTLTSSFYMPTLKDQGGGMNVGSAVVNQNGTLYLVGNYAGSWQVGASTLPSPVAGEQGHFLIGFHPGNPSPEANAFMAPDGATASPYIALVGDGPVVASVVLQDANFDKARCGRTTRGPKDAVDTFVWKLVDAEKCAAAP